MDNSLSILEVPNRPPAVGKTLYPSLVRAEKTFHLGCVRLLDAIRKRESAGIARAESLYASGYPDLDKAQGYLKRYTR